MNLPKEVIGFGEFLRSAGLSLLRTEEMPQFGSSVMQYGSSFLQIRIVSDRGIWYVEISPASQPLDWYDAALIRDLLGGSGDDVLPLSDQIAIVEKNWAGIVDSFRPDNREKTIRRLTELRKERAKRRFPAWRGDDPVK